MFTLLMFIVAVSIASCAAFFSIKGIGLLFAGSFISVVIMATSLEAGKLIAASFLYRKWRDLAGWLKIYLTGAVLLLMGITSLGIFGFLTDAYEKTKTAVDLYESSIITLESERRVIQSELDSMKSVRDVTRVEQTEAISNYKQIYDNFIAQQQLRITQLNSQLIPLDEELSRLQDSPGGIFSSKDKKIAALKEEQRSVRERIAKQLNDIDLATAEQYKTFMEKVDSINQEKKGDNIGDEGVLYGRIKAIDAEIMANKINISETDIGSFKFIARAFDIDTDTAVKWFTLIIVIVFDPLAVSLIIGYNAMIGNKPQRGQHTVERSREEDFPEMAPERDMSVVDRISNIFSKKRLNARMRQEN